MTVVPSYRNQSTDLLCKSMDWFPYDRGIRRHEKLNQIQKGLLYYDKESFLNWDTVSNTQIWITVLISLNAKTRGI